MLYRFDDFEFDTDKFELRHKGLAKPVEPLVFDLIIFLIQNSNRVVRREEIIDHIWKGRIISDATVSTCIKSARKVLGDSGESQNYIRTIRGRGFQFIGQVETFDQKDENSAYRERKYKPSNEKTNSEVNFPVSPGKQGEYKNPSVRRSGIFEKPILAVLPFNNLSSGFDEYFSDGLTEDIITNLSRFSELQVVGRTSTFQFKGRAVNLDEIRNRLNSDYIVEGSVRRAAGRVRVTAQLIDASNGVHLWADNYDRDMEDIFAVQDEVTRMIAATLDVKIQSVATQLALRKNPSELDAYDCVLRARRYTSMLSEDMHAEARDLLEKAVELDPTYGDAHALLANVYLAEYRFDANPRPDSISRALQMAQKATHLDPQNAYARCWLGIVHFFQRENEKFKAETQRALNLNPNDPEILADIGHYLAFMGEFERGVELSMRAQKLNPLHPGWYYFSSARYNYHRRNYQEVLADVQRISMPHFYWTHLLNAAALGELERQEAEDSLKQIYKLKPDFYARSELTKWNVAPKDFKHLMEGLQKAGLHESD